MRTAFLLLAALFVAAHPATGQTAGYPDFELVESTPLGTSLDNPDIRNAHEVWLEMIDGARKSLDIEEFYISNQAGESLEDIIQAIERAAGRDVTVRIIADARMQKTYPETIERLGKHKNIATRTIDYGKLAGGIQHAKFFIVDGETVFLGSQNFDWRALDHIHELGFRISHKQAAAFYEDVFTLDWNLAAQNDKGQLANFLTAKSYAVPFAVVEGQGDTLVFTPTASPIGFIPDSSLWDEPNIIRMIDRAKTDVTLQFLSYDTRGRDGSDYRVLDDAIRRAAGRGVKVRLIASDWEKGTSSEKSLKDLSTVPNIEVKFSVIPEWSKGYISFARVEHCKFIVADEASFWLGTSNAEKSYFYNTRNVGVVARNTKLARILHRVFMKSWEGPYTEPVPPETKYKKRFHGEKQDLKTNPEGN